MRKIPAGSDVGGTPTPGGRLRFHLQSPTERFRRLKGLLIADISVTDLGADAFVSEQFLDFPQILLEKGSTTAWRCC